MVAHDVLKSDQGATALHCRQSSGVATRRSPIPTDRRNHTHKRFVSTNRDQKPTHQEGYTND